MPGSGHSEIPSDAAKYGPGRAFTALGSGSDRRLRYARACPSDPGFRSRTGRDEQKFCVGGDVRNSRGSLPGISMAIASVCRRRPTVRYGSRLSRRTANPEAAPTRSEFLDEGPSSSAIVENAMAGRTFRGQDVEPLHHAEILMIEGMAMPDETADSDRIEVGSEGD